MESKKLYMTLGLVAVLVVVGYFVIASMYTSKNVMEKEKEVAQEKQKQMEQQKQTNESTQPAEDEGVPTAFVTETEKGFEPQTLTVKKGTKVVWMNKSGDEGNVSSAFHPTHLVYTPLNLGDFSDGANVLLVLNEAGSYKYHDHLNPSRFGSIIVTE